MVIESMPLVQFIIVMKVLDGLGQMDGVQQMRDGAMNIDFKKWVF